MIRALDRVLVGDYCWIWVGNRDHDGYGYIGIANKRHIRAHKMFYEFFRGPMPEGLVSDHICRVTSCVKPSHIRPATIKENTVRASKGGMAWQSRKTHCVNGHEFTFETTRYVTLYDKRLQRVATQRRCRTCRNDKDREHYAARLVTP